MVKYVSTLMEYILQQNSGFYRHWTSTFFMVKMSIFVLRSTKNSLYRCRTYPADLDKPSMSEE